MDNDKVTILKDVNYRKGLPNFKILKEFKVGQMPFDAMIKDNNYIVGFFLSKAFGVVDLEKMSFSEIKITTNNNKPVLKVPHFGFWSIGANKIFIPAVGDNKVMVYDNNFKFIKNIEVKGLPVFTSLSPNKKFLRSPFRVKIFQQYKLSIQKN